jgi:hypothetical protein
MTIVVNSSLTYPVIDKIRHVGVGVGTGKKENMRPFDTRLQGAMIMFDWRGDVLKDMINAARL